MRTLFGFLACKLGLSCSSKNSKEFIDGWFLGSGIRIKIWIKESRPFFNKFKISFIITSKGNFKIGFNKLTKHNEIVKALSFKYFSILLTIFKK